MLFVLFSIACVPLSLEAQVNSSRSVCRRSAHPAFRLLIAYQGTPSIKHKLLVAAL